MKYYLEILVFIIGAVVMVFELVGSRLLAPQFGTSIIVWTNLIGVILGSLSLGYYFGGKMADFDPSEKKLSLLVLFSALAMAAPFALREAILYSALSIIPNIKYAALAASVLLFSPGSVFLGAINPYAVKLRLSSLETGGRVVGRMSALGTLGSIAGTFFAGFFLVPYFGSSQVIWFLVCLLLVVSLFLGKKHFLKSKTLFIAVVFLMLFFDPFEVKSEYLVDRIETSYNTISIEEGRLNGKESGPLRTLSTDPYGIHGGCLVNDCGRLVFQTLEAFFLGTYLRPDVERALMIGGGTYSFPKEFARQNPNTVLDVVEIDPGFTMAAEKYFDWQKPENVNIFHEDGRTYINDCDNGLYDIVFVDAFNSRISIPFHLATKEAVSRLSGILDEKGLAVVNIIASLKGPTAEFLEAEYRTYKEYFPFVHLFPIQYKDADPIQNIMLVAGKKEFDLNISDSQFKKIYSHYFGGQIRPGRILTDNYAPVEYMNFGLLKEM